MDQRVSAGKINHTRKLNTLDEVALRILCASVSTTLDEYSGMKLRSIGDVREAYDDAEKFLHEAERRNPSYWGGK